MGLWPQFNPRTRKRVGDILRSGRVNYWTGPEGRKFEAAFARYLGVGNAVSVSSGTTALHLALEALGIGSGDEVVVTPYSFRASATCAANVGAKPVYADVEEDHLLSLRTVRKVVTGKTRAIVVVHLYGCVVDLGPILDFARKRGIFVVEDCAQCLGGEYRGRKVGTWGDAGCFSFCQSKHITTGGEGGMVVAKDAAVLTRVASLRDHGWVVGSEPKAFDRVGYNARLTEIQSVIGRGELERFESWNLKRRRALADRLLEEMAKEPVVKGLPVDTPERRASFWLVPFVLDAAKLSRPVSEVIEAMQRKGSSVYRILWPLMAPLPVASELEPDTVGFWVHPTRTKAELKREIAIFRETVREFRVA